MNISFLVSARSLLLAMFVSIPCAQASAQISDSTGIDRDAMAVAPVETTRGLDASIDSSNARASLKRVVDAFESRLNASLAEK